MPTNKNRKKNCRMIYVCFLLIFLLLPIYVIGCHADSLAGRLTFFPASYPKGQWDLDSAANEVSTEVNFRNAKDQVLVGRYFEYQKIDSYYSADDSKNATLGSILYFHGNAGNISYLTNFALQLSRDLCCNVLIFDYSGYGKSEGNPSAKGILDDGRAARDWLVSRDRISRDQVIVYGQSLGGSVAIDIAAKDGARGLIVESSFTSLSDMGRKMIPFLPADYLLRERLASVEKIGDVNCPVFISHGKSDRVIPFSQGQRLFDNAKEPKTFYIPPTGNDYHSAPLCDEHREKLKDFIRLLR